MYMYPDRNRHIHMYPDRNRRSGRKRRKRTLFQWRTCTAAGHGPLSAAEEHEARKAFAMLQNKKLLTVNKRGRPASMAPVHAALAIRKGAFAKNRGASLSAESQLTAAATAYGGVPAKKIKEYLDLLAQCDAPESGARLLQTPFAARERLRRRAARVGLELADMTADGNCFYRAVAHIVIDLGVRSVGYRHSDDTHVVLSSGKKTN